MDEWIHKLRFFHKMEYYSVTERSKILIYGTTRMSLKDMLNERTLSQRVTYNSIFMKYAELANLEHWEVD